MRRRPTPTLRESGLGRARLLPNRDRMEGKAARQEPRPTALQSAAATSTSGRASLLFITGTDTGAGKTVLTALLLQHLRSQGIRALAMKPFATGAPTDARLLDRLQDGALAMPRLNPFRFRAPLAPLVSARQEQRSVAFESAVAAIESARRDGEDLLVEGCGGLLTPLGPDYTLRDLIARLGGRVIVCARDRLGVLNQVLLVREALRSVGVAPAAVVLQSMRRPDLSARSNRRALEEFIAPAPVLGLPWLGPRASTKPAILAAARRLRSRLCALQVCLGIRTSYQYY